MAITRRHLSQSHAALDSERALAIDALRLARLLRDPSTWPVGWSEPPFAAEVERCRRHVADLTTQEALAAEYEHDVFVVPADIDDSAGGSPIRIAYALRWLEIEQGSTGPSWPAMVR